MKPRTNSFYQAPILATLLLCLSAPIASAASCIDVFGDKPSTAQVELPLRDAKGEARGKTIRVAQVHITSEKVLFEVARAETQDLADQVAEVLTAVSPPVGTTWYNVHENNGAISISLRYGNTLRAGAQVPASAKLSEDRKKIYFILQGDVAKTSSQLRHYNNQVAVPTEIRMSEKFDEFDGWQLGPVSAKDKPVEFREGVLLSQEEDRLVAVVGRISKLEKRGNVISLMYEHEGMRNQKDWERSTTVILHAVLGAPVPDINLQFRRDGEKGESVYDAKPSGGQNSLATVTSILDRRMTAGLKIEIPVSTDFNFDRVRAMNTIIRSLKAEHPSVFYRRSKAPLNAPPELIGENSGHHAYLQDGKRVKGFEISDTIYQKLLGSESSPMKDFPQELNRVQPGQELRVYFEGNARRIRLVLRRGVDHGWYLGMSLYDSATVSEGVVDGYPYVRLTTNEKHQLKTPAGYDEQSVAEMLTGYMREISRALSKKP